MIETILRIRPTEVPERTAEAWFIAGDDPRVWLDELGAWRIALDDVRLYLLPRSLADRRPCGALVVPPAGLSPEATVRAEPYGKHGGRDSADAPHTRRLYLPLTARLNPPASEAEIEAALAGDLAVWHPTAGLAGFDERDALVVAELLEKPVERSCSWSFARPGCAAAPRLLAVLPAAPPGPEESLAQWRDDIGSQAGDELPPAPREPGQSPLAQLGEQARSALARLALKLTSLAPRTATTPTWVNRLENWARGQVARLGNAFDAARRKEINRLLHLLDTDPDRGLRHALPLGGGGYRGQAEPGSRLPARDLDFRLDRLGGGQPVDSWQVDHEQQAALRRRYRELANREMELGRHRRAAYIFAELLGDVAAAAGALEQGGHHREAAALYRDRLHRLLDAARCLERCGGWDEAIEIYVEHHDFEKAAELLRRLERFDEAAVMYRRVVDRCLERGDRLRAAKVLEEKLHVADEAVELLAAGWPSSTQAALCLGEMFSLLGRLARHEDTSRWISRLREDHHPPVELGQAVGALVEVARKYPNPPVRHEASDVTRVLVGRRLLTAKAEEAASLVRAVRSLVPQDDLLGRDATRWLTRSSPQPAPRRPKNGPPLAKLAVIETSRFRLPGGITYKTAVAFGSGFLAAGFSRGGVAAVRASFAGEHDLMQWDAPLAELRPLLLAADVGSPRAMLAVVGGPPLEECFLGQDRIGTPAWFTPQTLAVASSSIGVWWSIDDELLLSALRIDGSPFSSRQLSLTELGVRAEPRDEPPERLAVMLARRDEVYLGLGHTLVGIKGDRVEQTQLQGWIRQLTSAPLVLQLRLAASFEDYGAAVIWDDLNGRDVIEFGLSLERPELAFTLDGLLVAVNHHTGQIYSTSNRSIALRARFAGPGSHVAGVLCGERPAEFVILTEQGEVRGYRVE